ncbi:phosphoinositide phospholipase C 2-like, partial [Juglans regia]|uniref:Phosphoinositide phospholipase C n=1 Tax=Juglans regia TaxID=51240 RepID=A0A6P9ECR2_JUGRE
ILNIFFGAVRRTLTRPVELIKCLKAIRDHAFSVSDYPVVITFEDHLTPYYQSKVAQMVTKTFGELLYRSESELKEFPSPESLKKKILISTKPPKEFHDQASSSSKDETCNLNVEQMLVAWHDWDDQTGEENAVPQYKNLIAIRAAKPKGVKDIWAIDPDKVRRLSLSEQELENAVNTRGTDIVRFTQKNLLRVYPKGLRLDSSNYNPMLGWMHGAQMVALNMQGYGKYLWIMQGMFRANGGCGYVKKPNFLLEVTPSNEVFDPSDMPRTQKTLKVKVYLGEGWHSDFRHTHFDRFSPPDFFVRVGIAGVPADEVIKQTKAIEDEWLPMWNEEFEFPLKAPELAVLRIEVLEYDTSGKNDFGGQACLPVSELRTGIRVIPLHNKKGDKYNSVKLLMRFEFL